MIPNELNQDVEISFEILECEIRSMCYSELNAFDVDLFGQDLQLNLEENLQFPKGKFTSHADIVRTAQMSISLSFAGTSIAMDCLLENTNPSEAEAIAAREVIKAVRNAFSHGIAAPTWFVKPHKFEKYDLGFVSGPVVDLGALNQMEFDYAQIGGLAVWYRLKEYVQSL
ncbi:MULTISPECIES: hypothetical protein [Vibrio]|uniref:hypothetical protein n=1 Tax=Vibrio TaxID=662 RepID=UPI002075D861|nr:MULTISPECIES: hypothetical protein [Vibrio]USD33754.1 hypothetical protein J8Z27_06570 [Vibrio sp. SCSIO 43186]USD46825.1 hypothetical protein J4N38_06770 [Vibrio sp. SCSIO 43145]USD46855.1 hypothetical protein J4N38_06955 [Vibrio sp. SCSIO 43145]USD70879.1 hypothetical protein J4N41_06575 [Vibrio sp. SCSIO 43139]USD95789.1 hypothetical protein CTT30_06680 [Vibrio coralliilyticus]